MENKASSQNDKPAEEEPTPPEDVTKRRSFFVDLNKIKALLTSKPTKQQTIIISVVTIVIISLGAMIVTVLGNRKPEPNLNPIVEQKIVKEIEIPETVASKLTGVQVELSLNDRPVTGVMLENSVDARPQSGLSDAGIVFEAIAEGGITRFLALYQVEQPTLIGPIRSARPYYVQWAAGFDAAYTHSGGSGEALSLIRTLGLNDMDHGNYPNSFDRVSNRYAPHNVYTSMARLDSLRSSLGFNKSVFEPFVRIAEEPEEDEAAVADNETEVKKTAKPKTVKKASKIDFNISGPLYNTSYSYDVDSNTYARKMAGIKHLDEKSGKQIKPSVLIALITTQGFHSDGVHTTYKTTGTGSILLFQNGEVIEGKWSKSSSSASLKFTTNAGKSLELQPGQTWITAIPSGRVTHTP